MTDHARAVIVGGGVGGTSIAYHLAERGWTDIVARGSRGAHLGLHVPLGGPRRAAPLERHPHPDDDVRGRPVPPAHGRDGRGCGLARGRLAAAGVVAGKVRGAAAPGGLGADVRAAARAHHRRRGPGALPADVHGRGPRSRVAADRRLAGPVGARVRARRRCAREGRADHAAHARHAIDVRDGGVRGVEVEQRGERRRIVAEVVVLAGGMYTPELARARRHPRADRADGPRIPVHRGDRRRDP